MGVAMEKIEVVAQIAAGDANRGAEDTGAEDTGAGAGAGEDEVSGVGELKEVDGESS